MRILDAGLKRAAAARWKYRTQKIAKNSPSGNHRTTLSGYMFATKACIDNWKNVKQQYLLHMSSQYGELRPTSAWDRFVSLRHPLMLTDFVSWLHYCSDVAQREPAKLCTMFGRLLRWYGGSCPGAAITLGIGPCFSCSFFCRPICYILFILAIIG